MQTIQLSDSSVPTLGFGTYPLKDTDCREAVADAIAIGYRHIDTAQSYHNEEAVGQGIQDAGISREQLFLTTKIWYTDLAKHRVPEVTHESLRKLGAEYVDLLLVHWPNPEIDLRETLDALMELQNQGKTRHIGVSNFPPALVKEALLYAPIVCNQIEYHPYLAQEEILQISRENNLMVTAYSPVAHGKVMDEPKLKEIGEKYGKSPVQVTLRWLIQQPQVAAIPKAGSHAHRLSNLAIFDFELTADEMNAVAALSTNLRLVDPPWAPKW